MSKIDARALGCATPRRNRDTTATNDVICASAFARGESSGGGRLANLGTREP